MALWLKLQDTLPDHKKVIATAKALQIDRDVLVSKLIRLWLWAATNREDGFISEDDIDIAAERMRWQEGAQRLFEALCVVPAGYSAGLLEHVEGGYRVHDWADHVGALMDMREVKREQDRVRQQRRRDRLRAKSDNDTSETVTDSSRVKVTEVTRDCHACHASKTKTRLREDKENRDTEYADIPPENPLSSDPQGKPKRQTFKPPAVDDVALYCRERCNEVDSQRFVDFYAAKGWRVGNAPMKDWKAAVRTWEGRVSGQNGKSNPKPTFDPFKLEDTPNRYAPHEDDFSTAVERMKGTNGIQR